jgi:hypothetical protein
MQLPLGQLTKLPYRQLGMNGSGDCPAQVMVWVEEEPPPANRVVTVTSVASKLPAPSSMTSVSVSKLLPEASVPLLAAWWKVLQGTPSFTI